MDEYIGISDEVPVSLRPFFQGSRFRLMGHLGEGGMGTVYRAFDYELGKEVALKAMRRPGPDQLYILKREFRSRAGISHPNLVQLYDLVVGEDSCCYTMEIIDGVDFLRWIQPAEAPREPFAESSPLDHPVGSPLPFGAEPRLRAAFAQLVRGLHALHESGHLHRDIKPSNVLVTPEGRVVIVDFGLTAELFEDKRQEGFAPGLAGTLPYMSPEQLQGAPLTRASDFYAAGILLYEALTGARAFASDASTLARHKHLEPPPDPLRRAPGIPEDLAALARALLSPLPAARPDARAILARLSSGDRARPSAPAGAEPLPHTPAPRFVGRAAELDVLREALREVQSGGRPIIVRIHGPSGIGKSTLVREFLASCGRGLLVLRGRCRPQETVAYQALDAAIDELARRLSAPGTLDAQALVPPDAYALTRLFPMLDRVPAFRALRAPSPLPEAIELRERGAAALSELLVRLTRQRVLILWIDDAQSGDPDSAWLLGRLLRSPEAPAFLLLLTDRGESRSGPLLRYLIDEGRAPPDRLRQRRLGPLAPEETEALARQLLPGEGGEPVGSIVAQSEGNPFIACELARFLGAHPPPEGAPREQLDVSRLMEERILALPADQRALAEVAAVAWLPLDRAVALDGAGLDEGARPAISALCDGLLLRQSADGGEVVVTTYHDRVRDAVLAQLPPAGRVPYHRRLAEALERRGSDDVEALLVHWQGAGEVRRAGGYGVRAAERADRALAFDHAAQLYELSLAMLGDAADRPTLLERLAQALANAGRGPEAAARYLEAAAALDSTAADARVRRLKRLAAEQYMKSGRVGLGWEVLRSVLEELHIPVPRSHLHAVLTAFRHRLLFLLTPLRILKRPRRILSPDEAAWMDALWTAAISTVMMNYQLSDAFRTMHLRRILAVGDDSSLCLTLGIEAVMEAYLPGSILARHARKLIGVVKELAQRTGRPYDEALWQLASANVAVTEGRWRDMRDACERCEALLRQHCVGVQWELTTNAVYYHVALVMLGDLPRLRECLERFRGDAEQRGDTFGVVESYIGEAALSWLAADRATEAREGARRELAKQAPGASRWPENSYRRQNYYDFVALLHTALYQGDAWLAWKAVLDNWKKVRAGFLPLRGVGVRLRHARARAALAAAARLAPGESPPPGVDARWRRRALLRDARACARYIRRDPSLYAHLLAALVQAGLAHLGGDDAAARILLAGTVAGFDRADMALYREVARYALGELSSGEAGAAFLREAEAWMRKQGVVRPRALVATLAPGLGILPS